MHSSTPFLLRLPLLAQIQMNGFLGPSCLSAGPHAQMNSSLNCTLSLRWASQALLITLPAGDRALPGTFCGAVSGTGRTPVERCLDTAERSRTPPPRPNSASVRQEHVPIDHHSGHLPRSDQPGAVRRRDGEGEPAPLDPVEGGFCNHVPSHTDRDQMVELHPLGHAGAPFGQVPVERPARCLFTEGHQPRRAQHGHVAGPECDGGVGLADDEVDLSGQTGGEGHPGTIRETAGHRPLNIGGPSKRPSGQGDWRKGAVHPDEQRKAEEKARPDRLDDNNAAMESLATPHPRPLTPDPSPPTPHPRPLTPDPDFYSMNASTKEAVVIDTPVLERVLSEALRHGGDFAEVFAEDRVSSSAVLDDGRVEELSSGRDRGAGIRVVAGDTTGFAHTADLSEAGLLRAAEAASAVAQAKGGGQGTTSVAVDGLRQHDTGRSTRSTRRDGTRTPHRTAPHRKKTPWRCCAGQMRRVAPLEAPSPRFRPAMAARSGRC